MIKIKIAEIFRHRNETTFRPFIQAKHLFQDIGVEFVFEGDNCDLTWVGQASICDKNHLLKRAINRGLWFLDNKVEGDYVIFDGQDSATMMGTYEVFRQSKAKLLLKNTLYSNLDDYERETPHGRIYWNEVSNLPYSGYSIPDIDMNGIQLSGTNWLGTITPNWFQYKNAKKDIDVFALFSYPAKANLEFLNETSRYYDRHRRRCISHLDNLPETVKVAKLINGAHVPIQEYYNLMSRSKIIVAPFGYGEIAPRDIEAASLGAVLIKPDMSHINTIPNVYKSDITYVNCSWDYSDINDKITNILENWEDSQQHYVENMRKEYATQYNPEKLVVHTYNWLSKLEGFGT